jgi:hypothetical protein
MKLSKTLFLFPVASLLVAVSVGTGACSDSTDVTLTSSNPPPGLTFTGGKFGGPCKSDVYVEAGTGWAYCDNDVWAYTTTDPSTAGFMPLGTDDASTDAAPVEDSSPNDDARPGDGGEQGVDAGSDDGGQGLDASPSDDGGHQTFDANQGGHDAAQGH